MNTKLIVRSSMMLRRRDYAPWSHHASRSDVGLDDWEQRCRAAVRHQLDVALPGLIHHPENPLLGRRTGVRVPRPLGVGDDRLVDLDGFVLAAQLTGVPHQVLGHDL